MNVTRDIQFMYILTRTFLFRFFSIFHNIFPEKKSTCKASTTKKITMKQNLTATETLPFHFSVSPRRAESSVDFPHPT